MEISSKSVSPTVSVVSLNGALNARSAEEAKQTFRDLVEQGVTQVIVDLENVPFIDSSGLAALVSGLKTLGGEAANLKLAAPQSQAQRSTPVSVVPDTVLGPQRGLRQDAHALAATLRPLSAKPAVANEETHSLHSQGEFASEAARLRG